MKYAYSSDKTGLPDMPTMHKAIKTYLTELDLDAWGSGAKNWISELEYKRRAGFIPHSHNHGGFDVYNTHSSEFECTCDQPNDCMCESTIVLHGFRLMYEGLESGVHTVCLYYSQWSEDDVYGINKATTLAEIEIRFKTVKSLMTKMQRFVNQTLKNEA
jgi:hypothetical protein